MSCKTIIFILILSCLLPSCIFLSPERESFAFRNNNASYSENIIFEADASGARIVQSKNIGTLSRGMRRMIMLGMEGEVLTPTSKDAVYAVDDDIAITPEGALFAQDNRTIYSLDPVTFDIVETFEKFSKSRALADLSRECLASGKNIFPMSDIDRPGKTAGYLMLSQENKTVSLPYQGTAGGICAYNKTIGIIDGPLGDGLNVFDLYTGRKLWWSGEELFRTFYAVAVNSDTLYLLYEKTGSLVVEAYDFNYDAHARFGPGRKKLLWQNHFSKHRPAGKIFGFKELNALERLHELFAVEYSVFDEATGEAIIHATSLDPKTGAINWQKSDIVRVYTERYEADDNLFYFTKRNEPGMIYGVDQKTGEEKLKLVLDGMNVPQGIISTSDKLYHAVTEPSNKPPYFYSKFAAVDKKTGKTTWTITIDRQSSLPSYEDGIFYFGNKPDFFQKVTAGSIRQYEGVGLYSKEVAQKLLSKTAYAVDAGSGKVLWKARLEGGDESYVEKIMVKNNKVFIKSLSGWLYGIESAVRRHDESRDLQSPGSLYRPGRWVTTVRRHR